MLKHATIWATIDEIAFSKNMSRSGLARFCGLDATTFNNSKRFESTGQPRWPSMFTLSKVLNSTGISMAQFGEMYDRIDKKTGTEQ